MLGLLTDFVSSPKGKWITLAAWLIAAGVLISQLPGLGESTENEAALFLPEDAEATRAYQLARDRFPSDGTPVLVVFRDPEGLRSDCHAALKLGFNGKFAIHPAQVDIINKTFTPGAEEIAYAKLVVEAWEEAESAGRGSTSLDGKMIDVPVVKRARNLLTLAERLSKD